MISFQPNCWSEHEELEVVMLCAPSKLGVPDMRTAQDVKWDAPVHHEKAHENFLELKSIFEENGVKVIDYSEHLSGEDRLLSDQLINRYYVRDLACVFGNIIIPGNAGTSMRRPEYEQSHLLMKKWFPDVFQIHENNDLNILEYGDLLTLNKDAVFINVGMRTRPESVGRIKGRIFDAGFSEIAMIDLPRRADTLHLDMNCNVINKDLLVAKSYVRYFPISVITKYGTRYEMLQPFLKRHGFDVYWLEKYDSNPDINFLNLNPETLIVSKKAHKKMLKDHPKLKKKHIIEVDVTELEKGGGGIRCMTLPLRRKEE